MRSARFIRTVVLAVATATSLCAQSKDPKKDPDQIGTRDVGKGINFYSLDKEMALGKQLAQEVERSAKLEKDAVLTEFINRLTQNLARNSDVKLPVTARVIDSDEVNAFALPGGYLFVNTGLILRAETEAELAGPIAHEIAHVAARHGTRQVSRGQVADLATMPLIFVGGWGGYAARQGAGLALPLGFLKFSRSFEQEADLFGIQYMYKSGYDPNAFIDFFERMSVLERKKPGTVSEIFRSHPNMDKRIKTAQSTIQTLPEQNQYVLTTSEFDDVRKGLSESRSRRKGVPSNAGPTLYRSKDRTGADGETNDADGRPTLKRRSQLPIS